MNTVVRLALPHKNLPSAFFILSKHNFAADITSNFFTVFSVESTDQGKKYTVSMSSVPTDAKMPTSYFGIEV
jgi:hypothetical protein